MVANAETKRGMSQISATDELINDRWSLDEIEEYFSSPDAYRDDYDYEIEEEIDRAYYLDPSISDDEFTAKVCKILGPEGETRVFDYLAKIEEKAASSGDDATDMRISMLRTFWFSLRC